MVEPCFLQKKVKAKIAVYLEKRKKLYYVDAMASDCNCNWIVFVKVYQASEFQIFNPTYAKVFFGLVPKDFGKITI